MLMVRNGRSQERPLSQKPESSRKRPQTQRSDIWPGPGLRNCFNQIGRENLAADLKQQVWQKMQHGNKSMFNQSAEPGTIFNRAPTTSCRLSTLAPWVI